MEGYDLVTRPGGALERVCMVGGSNTGMRRGYTAQILDHFSPECAVRHTMGASTSIYGLCNITSQRLFDGGGRCLFEYTLNDISYHRAGLYDHALLGEVLLGLCELAQRHDVQLSFVLMCPRIAVDDVLTEQCPVTATYKSIARLFDFAAVDVTRLLIASGFTSAQIKASYAADGVHYNPRATAIIGEHMVEHLSGHTPVAEPRQTRRVRIRIPFPGRRTIRSVGRRYGREAHARGDALALTVIPAAELTITGPHTRVLRATSELGGEAVRMLPGSRVRIPLETRLMGIIANTAEDSGYVRVTHPGGENIKNMFDVYFLRTKARIFLKQFSPPIGPFPGEVCEIACDVRDTDLVLLPREATMHEAPPLAAPHETAFEILGVVTERARPDPVRRRRTASGASQPSSRG